MTKHGVTKRNIGDDMAKKKLKIRQGAEAVLMSNRNKVHEDKKKKENKNKCKKKLDNDEMM